MSDVFAKPRPPATESQLRAMANGVDRANKPTSLMILGVIVLVGFALYAVAGLRLWSAAKSSFARTASDSQEVERLVREYQLEKARTPDLARMYPPLPTMGADIEKAAKNAWQSGDQPAAGVSVGNKSAGRLFSDKLKALDVYSIDCSVQDQPLEKIMTWLRTVETEPFLGPTFVSSLTLSPANSGWQAQVKFSVYEKKR